MGYTGAMSQSRATKGRLVLVGGLVLAATAALHPLGCGGTAVMDHDDAGAGGGTGTGTGVTPTGSPTGTPSGSPTGNPTGTPSGSPTGTQTGTTTCDDQGDCGACQNCALEGLCSSYMEACQASADCQSFFECVNSCTDQTCFDACVAQYPTGASMYDDLALCVFCDACYNDCDGASIGCP